MNPSAQIAKHLRQVYFGGNWTCSNLKDQLADVSWQQAVTKLHNLNTIVALVYHIGYYTSAILGVLEGWSLSAKDTYSFDHPPVHSREDWEKLLKKTWSDAETLADAIEKLPEQLLWKNFTDEKYGNYYRNIHGLIEHTHYHLGQIALIKKLLLQQENTNS